MDLGDAKIPNDDNPAQIKVEADATAQAPTLALNLVPPHLASLDLPGTTVGVDNAAPGTVLDLRGSGFGFKRGAKFEVRFNSATVTSFKRISEELIRVVVPTGATNGNVLVLVSNVQSEPAAIRIMDRFDLGTLTKLTLALDATRDLAVDVRAFDTKDQQIVECTTCTPSKRRPTVFLTSDADAVGILPGSVVKGLALGTASVTVWAGDLASRSIVVTVNETGLSEPASLSLSATAFEGVAQAIGITVRDQQVKGTGGQKASVTVQISSGGEPGGETVTLTEATAGSGVFSGTVPLSRIFDEDGSALTIAGDGKIAIYAEGGVATDSIAVTYGSLVERASYTEPASTITGIVDVAGSPVGGAIVTLTGPQSRSTVTRSDGSYAFHDVPSGQYLLVAKAQNATRLTLTVTVP